MTWDIFLYSIGVVCLSQGEKINTSSVIQIKVKNNKTKTNGVEIIFNTKLQLPKQEKTLLEHRPAHFEKKKINSAPKRKHIFLRLA